MAHQFSKIAFTPAVRAEQESRQSRKHYARMEQQGPPNDRLGSTEREFLESRDGFYMASVSETGWPYVQFRGGPAGFLKALDDRTIAYADFLGNRQYISTGNLKHDGRVALILMDYANRRRLKILGRAEIRDAAEAPELTAALTIPAYKARVERAVVIHVEAFDWNCPQHITPRFTVEEVEAAVEPLRARLVELEEENQRLRAAQQA